MQKERIRPITALVILSLFIFIITSFIKGGVGQAYAATSRYSDVLSDLTTDSDFDPSEYPTKADDYSINVIQIAESTGGELFVYTYQPCQKTKALTATQINMSLAESAENTKLYSLSLLNSNGVFCKYKVNGVTVSDEDIRYYNISSIYRIWDNNIDGEIANNNTGEQKAYTVAKLFRVTTENNQSIYTCDPTYVVNILNPYSDYLLYITATSLPPSSSIQISFQNMGMIDAHYIAFSTDIEIDRLKSATVKYNYRSGEGHYETFLMFDVGADVTYGSAQTDYAYPAYYKSYERSGDFWHTGLNYCYSWDRIQTVSDFIATEQDLTEETINNLEGKEWVLRFLETERTQTTTNIAVYKKYTTTFTKVDSVAVLRLEFDTDGTTYNLGAVSDMVSGDELPGNMETTLGFWAYIWRCIVRLFNGTATLSEQIVAVITLFIALLILPAILTILSLCIPAFGKFMKTALSALWTIIKYLFIGIWYIITSPFRLIAWFIGRKGNDGGGSKTND